MTFLSLDQKQCLRLLLINIQIKYCLTIEQRKPTKPNLPKKHKMQTNHLDAINKEHQKKIKQSGQNSIIVQLLNCMRNLH